ncbi:MAG: glycosyltransferase family 2 protein [Oscillospiraceae bacterium]|nr:glycosyltransferase family 2 protein [Oscillospiraceae bacterium]
MSDIKITAIMPVYKVEDYICKAIDSLRSQTLTDWELIAVDDGSPDDSGKICDEYAAKDSRITVIHKKNGGAPSARNAAIPKARGEYLYFMDSDDWAEPTMFEDMYRVAKENDAQLVVAGYYIDTYYSDKEFYTQEQCLPSKAFVSQQEFREYAHEMFDKNLLYTPWNKLFKRDYIIDNNIRFKNTFWDDFPFNLDVVRDVERVVLMEQKYYHFMRARAESETAKYRSDMLQKREEEHGWMLELYGYWGVDSEESAEMIQRRYIERMIGCIENVTNSDCTLTSKEKREQIKKMITSERTRTALKTAKPRSLVMKTMLIPLKMKSTALTYLEGTVISRVKSGNVKLFASLKANR